MAKNEDAGGPPWWQVALIGAAIALAIKDFVLPAPFRADGWLAHASVPERLDYAVSQIEPRLPLDIAGLGVITGVASRGVAMTIDITTEQTAEKFDEGWRERSLADFAQSQCASRSPVRMFLEEGATLHFALSDPRGAFIGEATADARLCARFR